MLQLQVYVAKMHWYLVCGSLCLFVMGCYGDSACAPRTFSSDSNVCVCNSSYCDTLNVQPPKSGELHVYTSSRNGKRFAKEMKNLNTSKGAGFGAERDEISLRIYKQKSYQAVKGFGGALTDAASINMMSLSSGTRSKLLRSYFGDDGIEYNIVRVPIASCDFSTREYTYLDTPNDFNLSTFALAEEDTKYKIPLLKLIYNHTTRPVSLYASPWTAPAWMKTNDDEVGYGRLRGKPGDHYHKTWAEYFTRFFDAYKKEGITFWGVTMQNEPSNGLIIPGKWQSMGWLPSAQRDFVKTDLGPMLKEKGYGDIQLMIHDDQRLFLPYWPKVILSDADAAKYVSGVAVHWYFDWLVGPEVLNETHNLFPDKFLLATEACDKDPPMKEMGSWNIGEKYSNDVLDNLNNWAIGWVDWNMCLDLQGGPNWVSNFDDSPIIVNATADEFYKQPMFYHLGHFSKFIPEGSVRIHSELSGETNLKYVAIMRKDALMVLVVANREDKDVSFQVDDGTSTFNATISSHSIQTYVWKN